MIKPMRETVVVFRRRDILENLKELARELNGCTSREKVKEVTRLMEGLRDLLVLMDNRIEAVVFIKEVRENGDRGD